MKNHRFVKNILFIGVLFLSTFSLLAQIEIPVAIHIARDNNGNNARATFTQTDNEIVALNNAFNYLGITFVKCSEGYVDDSVIWNQFDDGDESQKLLLDPYSNLNVVNLFYTDLEGGGHGKAVFPYKQKDWVAIDYQEISSTTVIHEFGHYFGLHHTYSDVDDDNPASSSSLTISDAEGPEGWKYGDYLIDTPLDPENRSDYNNLCNYIGNQLDANGDAFNPDGKNYMGKGHNFCRDKFSTGQEARMLEYIKRYRYYLACNNSTNNNLTCSNSISISTFPHNDDFERDDISSYWVQARHGDDMNWSNGPSTSTTNSGPNAAQNGQTFVYLESSLKYTSSDEAILLSPCYDFSGKNTAQIEFYYHMYGSKSGTLTLEASTNNGVNWTSLFTISGEQHQEESTPWTKQTVNLDSYTGSNVQLRFSAVSDEGSSRSDISIDNVTVSAENSLSIVDNELNNSMSLYPNPTSDKITLKGGHSEFKKIKLYNFLGQDVTFLVEVVEVDKTKTRIDLSNLNTGLYFINTKNTSKIVYKK